MEESLKQRLVGASVLVVLAVIFLPLLLDGSGMAKPTAPLSLDLPEANAANTVTITLKPKRIKTEQVLAPAVVAPVSQPKPEPTPEPKVVAKPKAQPVIQTQPKKVAAQTGGEVQWIVQLGSFSQRGNAQTLRDKLINSGYKSFVESSGQGRSQVYRVRVGPESSRERAEAIRIKLKDREKRNGLVMVYP